MDLNSHDGLGDAVRRAGSWAELSRQTGVAASTLKSRAARLNVRSPDVDDVSEAIDEFAQTVAHAIVASLIEHEKGMPIEAAWQLHERFCARTITTATKRLLTAAI